jgi:hypothetical protein
VHAKSLQPLLAQQTPLTQFPAVHCAPVPEQVWPLETCCTHCFVSVLQKKPLAQFASVVQSGLQVPPLTPQK